MAGINSIKLNDNLQEFKNFVDSAMASSPEKGKTVASTKYIGAPGRAYAIGRSEVKTVSGAGDKLHFWGRTPQMKIGNNDVRRNFFHAVVDQFGGDISRVPENVKKAMLLEDSGLDKTNITLDGAFQTGKPLLARRIDAVITEVEKALAKERGAKAFGSFYNSMKANANPSGGIKTNFNGAQKILTDFTSALLENASSLTLAKKNEMLQTCEDELSKMARQLDGFKLGEMVDRFGDFKMNKGIEACMGRRLKSLRDTLVGGLKSKYDQDMLKAGFNSFIDSMKTERKLDEKIAAAFAKQYQINGKLHSVDGNLAALNMKLNELESARPKNEDEIAKTKGEIEKQTAALKGSKTRTAVMDAAIKELFNDKEFCALAAKKDFGLVTRDVLADEGKFDKDVAASGKTGTLEKLEGSTSEAVAKFHAQHPNEKICVHVYGDRTFLFCGLLSNWTTQEESAVRDADVKTWAHLLGKGLIKPSKKVKDRFEMATDKMNSIKGFAIKTRMQFTRQVQNPQPTEVTFLFSSMPSLTSRSDSLDADGDYDFLQDCKALYDETNGWNVKKSELPRAKKFIKVLHDLFKGKSKYTAMQFKTALKLLKFSGPNGYFNVFGKDSKKEVLKLLDFVANESRTGEGKALKEIGKIADKNYEKVVRKHIREWIIQARETGSGVFIGGPIGCGVFGNDRKVVAKILAEEFKKNGGEMKFVYNLFADAQGKVSDDDLAQYEIFREAFAAAGLADRIVGDN